MTITKNQICILLAFCFITLCGGLSTASAQITDPFKDSDSTVVTGKWEGDLEDLEKPRLKLPKVEVKTDPKGLTYDHKEIQGKTSFTPRKPGKPKPIGKAPMPQLHSNFVKLGFGRFVTPLAKVYLNNSYNEQVDVGLDFTHLSASNTSSYADYAEFREDYGTAKFNYLLKDHSMGGKVYVNNTSFFYYADSMVANRSELTDTIQNLINDSLRNVYTKVKAEAYLKRNYHDEGVNWDGTLQFRNYSDRMGNKDLHFSILPNLNWKINPNFSADVDLNLTFSNSTFDTATQSRLFFDFTPTATYQWEELWVQAGLKVNSFNDSLNTFGAYPILRAQYNILPEQLTAFAGLKGEMKYNTFYDQVEVNRYLRTRDVKPDIRPTREKLNIYGGVSGSVTQYVNFSAKAYYKVVEDQLMYFNEENGAYFDMVYDTAFKETGAELSVLFNMDDKIKAGVNGKFRSFKTSNIAYNYGVPNTRVDIWGSYNFGEKVWVASEIYVLGKRNMSVDSLGMPITQNALADINLSVDYRFNKRISVFLELNNILGNEYYRWHNYQERPFDLKAGVTASF